MQVFETSSLASIRMKNRILRSATYEGMCDALGHPQPSYYELYEKISGGGAGAIITGYVAVNRTGRMTRFMGIIDDDAYSEEFGKLSSIVHANDTLVIMQIAHCGGFSSKAVTNVEPVAPSPFVNRLTRQMAGELSENGIEPALQRKSRDGAWGHPAYTTGFCRPGHQTRRERLSIFVSNQHRLSRQGASDDRSI